MRTVMLYVVCAMTIAASQGRSLDLKVGEQIPSALVPKDPDFITLPDFLPVAKVSVEGINYEVAYSPETHVIKHILTEDKNFVTVDGLRVGMCMAVSKKQVVSVRHGLTRAPKTADGWTPVIGYRAHVTKCEQGIKKTPPTICHVDTLPAEADGVKVNVKVLKFIQ